jgi:hypothetical protein
MRSNSFEYPKSRKSQSGGGGGAKCYELRFSPAKIFGGRRRKTPLRFCTTFFAFASSNGKGINDFRSDSQAFAGVLGKISLSKMAGKGIGCLSEALSALRISASKVWFCVDERSNLFFFAMG